MLLWRRKYFIAILPISSILNAMRLGECLFFVLPLNESSATTLLLLHLPFVLLTYLMSWRFRRELEECKRPKPSVIHRPSKEDTSFSMVLVAFIVGLTYIVLAACCLPLLMGITLVHALLPSSDDAVDYCIISNAARIRDFDSSK